LSQPKKRSPFKKIKLELEKSNLIPSGLISELPHHWKRVGKIGILELSLNLQPWKELIGSIYLNHLPELTTIAQKVGVTNTEIRTPNFEYIAGRKSPITLHKELGAKFWIDAFRLTFSSGNHFERLRLTKICSPYENILDMFACVGNLSIPIIVHNPTVKVKAIEINPHAFMFLKKNISINKITRNYEIYFGDNREIIFSNFADRILMGYFGIDQKQIHGALKALNVKKGGIIHAHGLSGKKNSLLQQQLFKKAIQEHYPFLKIISIQRLIIKTVAAGVFHFVDDIKIGRAN
jgi:tRNA G37 N-methylase Trm5